MDVVDSASEQPALPLGKLRDQSVGADPAAVDESGGIGRKV